MSETQITYACNSRISASYRERFSDVFGQDAEDRSIAMAIHQALVSSVRLETFPKATIDIFITIIETDGIEGCVAAGSIAASSALTHAGIEIIGLVISCSAVGYWYLLPCIFTELFFLKKKAIINSEVWLDPTDEESSLSNGTLVLSCMPALKKVTSVWQKGRMESSEVIAVSAANSCD